MSTQFEVIVIGAGPSGALAARTLAEQGRQVLLLERGRIGQRRKACGGMLPPAFARDRLDPHTIQTRLEQEMIVFPWGERVQPAQWQPKVWYLE
jgi:geranylgeranyl reductase